MPGEETMEDARATELGAGAGETPPRELDPAYYEEGQELTGGLIGGREHRWRVQRVDEDMLVLEIRSLAGPGRRWAFNRVPYGSLFRIERVVFKTAGGTSKTIRLRPYTLLPEVELEGENAGEEANP